MHWVSPIIYICIEWKGSSSAPDHFVSRRLPGRDGGSRAGRSVRRRRLEGRTGGKEVGTEAGGQEILLPLDRSAHQLGCPPGRLSPVMDMNEAAPHHQHQHHQHEDQHQPPHAGARLHLGLHLLLLALRLVLNEGYQARERSRIMQSNSQTNRKICQILCGILSGGLKLCHLILKSSHLANSA